MNDSRKRGPQRIGDTTGDLLSTIEAMREKHRQRVEAAALPGETFEQAEARVLRRDERTQASNVSTVSEQMERAKEREKALSLVRKPPKGDEQADFLVPNLYDGV